MGRGGVRRRPISEWNFEVLEPNDYLAPIAQHIPDKGAQRSATTSSIPTRPTDGPARQNRVWRYAVGRKKVLKPGTPTFAQGLIRREWLSGLRQCPTCQGSAFLERRAVRRSGPLGSSCARTPLIRPIDRGTQPQSRFPSKPTLSVAERQKSTFLSRV